MAKPNWGNKRICPSCSLKYYDFNKSPITCPVCSVEFDPDLYLKSRKGKSLSLKADSQNSEQTPEIETAEEVTNDADETPELNKESKDEDSETDIDISFIDDDDDDDDDDEQEVISVDVTEDEKD